MIKDDKRVRIITGHYGSGKSEFSLNYVLKLREVSDKKVALADLDVINPYFRTRERKALLEENDIKVIASSVDTPSVDIPAISAEVSVPLVNTDYDYVMDLGGDEAGPKVIGSFRNYFDNIDGYDMFFILNANREKTQTAEDAFEYMKKIERTSNLKVTGIINNTHFLKATTVEDVLHGQEVARELSKLSGVPIKYTACLEKLVKDLPDDIEGDVVPIKLLLRDDWMM